MGYREIDIEKSIYSLNSEEFKGIPTANPKTQTITKGKGAALWKQATNGYVFMPVTLGGLELWNPIIRLTGRKTIVETALVERQGSVKEIINMDDYVINIRGTIKTTDGTWPDKEVEQLISLYQRNESIPIISAITAIALVGNENVVITNINLPEQQGKTESVAYEIECTSDIAFELELK